MRKQQHAGVDFFGNPIKEKATKKYKFSQNMSFKCDELDSDIYCENFNIGDIKPKAKKSEIIIEEYSPKKKSLNIDGTKKATLF